MAYTKNVLIWMLVAVVLFFCFGGFGTSSYNMMGYGFPPMLLFWGAIIWLAVSHCNTTDKDDEDSLVIIKKRYASGEISKKQYEEMKKELIGK